MVSCYWISVPSCTSDTSDEDDSSINVTKRGEDFNILLQKSGRTFDRPGIFIISLLNLLHFGIELFLILSDVNYWKFFTPFMIYHLKAVDLGILTASHNKNHQQSDCEALVHNGLKRENQKVQKS